MSLPKLVIVGVLMELAYLSFYLVDESPNELLLFICVHAIAFLLLSFVLYKSAIRNPQSEPPKFQSLINDRSSLTFLGFAILFRLTLIFHLPVASDDIYRYVWDGKVAAHGINPFVFAPTDSSLHHLHSEHVPSRINHPTMRTIYPPLAQILFYISNTLFGDSIVGLKLLLVIADAATLLLLLVMLKGSETFRPALRDSGFLVYAWSPLPILYFGLDGHIDALGIPFLLLFIYLASRNKRVASAVALGLAGLAKLYPLFVAPFLFCIAQGWRKVLLPLIPIAMLIVGCWFYWEPTGGLIESFKVFNSQFEFNGSIFHIVYWIVEKNQQAHLVSSILFLCWLGVVFFLNRSLLEKTFLAFLGFIILAPVVQPWYLTWLAALLALRWSTAVFVLLGLSNLSNIVVYNYRMSGVWEDNIDILLVEYVPFFALLIWEFIPRKKREGSYS